MSTSPPHIARDVIARSRYMVLGTADAAGTPWVSPVWFASVGLREFIWASRPEARHSQNLAARDDVSLVIFDSRVVPGDAQAVYVAAVAEELSGAELERAVAVYAARSAEQGLREWTAADVSAPARHRLYRASARESFVLGPGDERLPLAPAP
jgi:nitroimidazol reductase NimA-like FMN-containing flavoprotein (pyridoxamine 5'-phosphate oxidase superfamily)